ncbi:hypothetical protein FHS95_000326 [Sphingomonas naasensis]|uniref:Fe2OG dioxygenase domain-containing protein n=1 Tax=Sphingomonas naasensis TaxID=1344951 RepID=A0A4S1WU93_9SPHN|nr:phytanoyl-CoA dioxygenase family protein [Sphingomonas naasensis]NIJ18657.1 hypothetical protein [Sphingomonas naasensis]TGX45897.1 hypothetical protein E5A74_01615 [Sphingomonas naasensis]
MEIEGDYRRDGYALVRGLVPAEVCAAILGQMQTDAARAGRRLEDMGKTSPILPRPASEIYGYHYPPLLMFLWGLTPMMAHQAGCELMPTYNYFRIYRGGDRCRVHSDRQSCEHSVSLTLAYSDSQTWDFEIGEDAVPPLEGVIEENFGPSRFGSIRMSPGDAVIYNGITRRHGRTTPNPNQWSAHLFCHWVEAAGPYADWAFDRRGIRFPMVQFDFG